MSLEEILASWRHRLIVSCQAPPESPLARPEILAALALTAVRNGAGGVRLDGPAVILAARPLVAAPIVGIEKQVTGGSDVYITPTWDSAVRVAEAGADVIAIDATARERPGGVSLAELLPRIRRELDRPVLADVATFDEGMNAAERLGADLVATTLAGYTAETRGLEGPEFALVERLAARLAVPVVCEGRVRDPDDVRRAFDCGAFAVVVGQRITGVDWLVRHFVQATPAFRRHVRPGPPPPS